MTPAPPSDADEPEDGRARADRELRTAVLVAIPVLVLGQVLLLAGWWQVAMVVAIAGTVAAFVLARRWSTMAGSGR